MTSKPRKALAELDDYDGRWVAIRDGVVVAHADDEETLRREHVDVDGDLSSRSATPVRAST